MHHPCTHDFNKSGLFTQVTTLTRALETQYIDLNPRLNKREETWTKPYRAFFSKKFLKKKFKRPLKVRERNVFPNHKPFNLVELHFVSCVRCFVPKHTTGHHDREGGFIMLHIMNLHCRRVRPQQ